jgi:hypothetical protein
MPPSWRERGELGEKKGVIRRSFLLAEAHDKEEKLPPTYVGAVMKQLGHSRFV